MPMQPHPYDAYASDVGDLASEYKKALADFHAKGKAGKLTREDAIAFMRKWTTGMHVNGGLLDKAAKTAGNVAKSVGKAAGSVGTAIGKVAIAPAKLAVDAAHGKNIAKELGKQMASAGQVVSFVPGIGTAVGAGLKIGGAGLQGQNIAKAAVNAAKTSVPYATMAIQAVNVASDIARGKNVLGAVKARAVEAALAQVPGGEYGQQLARSVANVAAAGVKGQNVLKAGAKEVVASAVAMAPADARSTLNAAINAAASGQNPLTGAMAAATRQALNAIPDMGARQVAQAALVGKSAATVLANAPKTLLARAVATVPNGGAAATLNALTGTVSQGTATMNALNNRPIFSASRMNQVLAMRPAMGNRVNAAGVRHIPLSGAAKAFVRARAGNLAKDAAGLNSEGKWLVTKGDTGSSIAKALTGDANRWKELTTVNPTIMKNRASQVKQYGFPIYVNDVINIPASWVHTTVTPQAKPTTVQVTPAATANTPVTPITTVIQNASTVLAPLGDTAAQAAARATLAAWSKTDGLSSSGLADYGSVSEAVAMSWTARDKLEAASFQNWANKSGLSTGATTGDWSQELADALRMWAERKATQVVPTVTAATTTPVQTPTQTPTYATGDKVLPPTTVLPTTVTTPAVTVTPGSAGNGTITLPGITITPAAATTTQPAAQSSQPSFWAQNKPQIISAASGLAIALGAKFVR